MAVKSYVDARGRQRYAIEFEQGAGSTGASRPASRRPKRASTKSGSGATCSAPLRSGAVPMFS